MRQHFGWRLISRTLLVVGFALGSAQSARAEVDFGVRGGFYDDADAGFLGGELLMGITGPWFFNPNFEYVFVDDGSLGTLNADAHYDFPSQGNLSFWAGGGPAVILRETDPPRGCGSCDGDDEVDIGLNLLGGIGLERGGVRPYLQGKVVLADDTEAVIALGLRFD
jgi:hypothetical protein